MATSGRDIESHGTPILENTDVATVKQETEAPQQVQRPRDVKQPWNNNTTINAQSPLIGSWPKARGWRQKMDVSEVRRIGRLPDLSLPGHDLSQRFQTSPWAGEPLHGPPGILNDNNNNYYYYYNSNISQPFQPFQSFPPLQSFEPFRPLLLDTPTPCEPTADSGYGSELPEACTNLSYLTAVSCDIRPVYSGQGGVSGPELDTYKSDLVDSLVNNVRRFQADSESLERIFEAMPELLRSFALALGQPGSTPAQRDVMYFIHKYRLWVLHLLSGGFPSLSL